MLSLCSFFTFCHFTITTTVVVLLFVRVGTVSSNLWHWDDTRYCDCPKWRRRDNDTRLCQAYAPKSAPHFIYAVRAKTCVQLSLVSSFVFVSLSWNWSKNMAQFNLLEITIRIVNMYVRVVRYVRKCLSWSCMYVCIMVCLCVDFVLLPFLDSCQLIIND